MTASREASEPSRPRPLGAGPCIDRRTFLLAALSSTSCRGARSAPRSAARRVAITIDDPTTADTPLLSSSARDRMLRDVLRANQVETMLFVCGKRVDSPSGRALLADWSKSRHVVGNHSYSHMNLNKPDVGVADFVRDVDRCAPLIGGLPTFRKRFRYPFLKEGDTREKRDLCRRLLRERGYSFGHVTIDTSDWAYDQRLVARLIRDPSSDLGPFRSAYLSHMIDRANYYDALATELLGRKISHTLLIHHSLTSALFLGDLLRALTQRGWTVIGAEEAYADPVFSLSLDALPAGESLIWALAQADGRYAARLRYPGESDVYEAEALDRLEPSPH